MSTKPDGPAGVKEAAAKLIRVLPHPFKTVNALLSNAKTV